VLHDAARAGEAEFVEAQTAAQLHAAARNFVHRNLARRSLREKMGENLRVAAVDARLPGRSGDSRQWF
jgi:hypothetical protein